MQTYLDMLDHVLTHGRRREDRTGVGTVGVFGHQLRFDLSDGFPLLTTKKVHTRSVVTELLWFLGGRTDVAWLRERGVTIWDEWVGPDGTIGHGYGYMWRHFPVDDGGSASVDQIAVRLDGLATDPFGRRHLVSAWHPGHQDCVQLPPCHTLFQFHVDPDDDGRPHRLNCQLYQRSADAFLGVPFNIASYALLTHLVADNLGLVPGDFVHTFGDLHIYSNHLDQVREQMSRRPRPLPRLEVDHDAARSRGWLVEPHLPAYEPGDFTFHAYDPHPTIKAPVAV